MVRKFGMGVAAIAAMALMAAAPAFADEMQEATTGAQHAGMAAGSADMKMVQMHLHHVVNCIVGPSGDGFDKAAGNPCDGKGDGAMMDAKPEQKANLEAALAKAKAGITATDVAEAKKDAGEAQALLSK